MIWFFSLAPAHTEVTQYWLILTQRSSEILLAYVCVFFVIGVERGPVPPCSLINVRLQIQSVIPSMAWPRWLSYNSSSLAFRLYFGSMHLNPTGCVPTGEAHVTTACRCGFLKVDCCISGCSFRSSSAGQEPSIAILLTTGHTNVLIILDTRLDPMVVTQPIMLAHPLLGYGTFKLTSEQLCRDIFI